MDQWLGVVVGFALGLLASLAVSLWEQERLAVRMRLRLTSERTEELALVVAAQLASTWHREGQRDVPDGFLEAVRALPPISLTEVAQGIPVEQRVRLIDWFYLHQPDFASLRYTAEELDRFVVPYAATYPQLGISLPPEVLDYFTGLRAACDLWVDDPEMAFATAASALVRTKPARLVHLELAAATHGNKLLRRHFDDQPLEIGLDGGELVTLITHNWTPQHEPTVRVEVTAAAERASRRLWLHPVQIGTFPLRITVLTTAEPRKVWFPHYSLEQVYLETDDSTYGLPTMPLKEYLRGYFGLAAVVAWLGFVGVLAFSLLSPLLAVGVLALIPLGIVGYVGVERWRVRRSMPSGQRSSA